MLSLPEELQVAVNVAVLRLDRWLQTMRQTGGYGGPVSHWWENSLLYCGPMADWRYEGILCAYLTLFLKTGAMLWLERALQAGEDLVAAQLPSGKFRNSSFQQGPMEGGTPHEAAVDVGLLELALLLKQQGDARWERYFRVAERNILDYQVSQLWNGRGFLDQPWNQTLVPNKNGTLIEALVLYEALSGHDMGLYINGAVNVILDAQEKEGPRKGAIVHLGTGRHRLAIGIYNARSVSGLVKAYERDPHDEYLAAVAGSLEFQAGLIAEKGVYFGRYPNGKLISNPCLVAGSGDILRAFAYGVSFGLADPSCLYQLVRLLVNHQSNLGGIQTAYGFAHRGAVLLHASNLDFRDVLPVVGWCDKAFRALSLFADEGISELEEEKLQPVKVECQWKGKKCVFQESSDAFTLKNFEDGKVVYQWYKNALYPDSYVL